MADIVGTYDWTSVPPGCMREKAPFVWVEEYEPEASALRAFAKGYMSLGNDKHQGMEFYEQLYEPARRVEEHRFPYFNDNVRSFTNDYADTFSNISQRGAQFLGAGLVESGAGMLEETIGGAAALAQSLGNNQGAQLYESVAKATEGVGNAAAKLFGASADGIKFKLPRPTNPGENPGSYIETPKFYQYANTDVALEVNFVLSNTLGDDNAWEKNHEFIMKFTRGARPTRKGAVAMTFPHLYKVRVPGWRYIPWASLANFAVAFLGSRRMISKKIVPEAYGISMTFHSLTIEVENFLDEVD